MFGLFKKKQQRAINAPKEPNLKEKKSVEEPQEVEITEQPIKERKMSYHITRHPQGGWQIKKGKADRALKRFETQKEAIDYAKTLEKERGISFIIHKADGSTRKKKY